MGLQPRWAPPRLPDLVQFDKVATAQTKATAKKASKAKADRAKANIVKTSSANADTDKANKAKANKATPNNATAKATATAHCSEARVAPTAALLTFPNAGLRGVP